MSDLFKEFDFNLLDDPNFKEDSVREEIVFPILKELGYSAAGEDKIIRSKTLKHPFVHIGSSKQNINIIPDYLIKSGEQNLFILDAKAPNENITKGKNIEQAYSYAIHSDIRTPKYALCNGREISIFDVRYYQPKSIIKINELNKKWFEVEKELSPLAFKKPYIFNFHPDFGLATIQFGFNLEMDWHFCGLWVNQVGRVSDDLYSIASSITFGDNVYCASLDFGKELYPEFLSAVPKSKRELIEKGMRQAPYFLDFNNDSFEIYVNARLGREMIENEDENYVPLKVIVFKNIHE